MPILIPDYLVVPFPLASSKSGFEEIVGADLNYLKLSINNELIPSERILFNGASPPVGGFISINRTLGTMLFHVSDVGKFVSGTYSLRRRANNSAQI